MGTCPAGHPLPRFVFSNRGQPALTWHLHDIAIPNRVCVWHKRGSVGGRILRNGRALVLQ